MGSARLLRYVLRRLLQAIPVVLGVVVLNFLLLQLAPGDAATVLAGEAGGAPAEYVQALRQRFGLDQPVPVQLALYVKNILALDLGYSFRNQSPVLPLILARLSATLLLMGTTLVLSLGIGVLLGLLAAVWVRTWKDHLISVAAIIAYNYPNQLALAKLAPALAAGCTVVLKAAPDTPLITLALGELIAEHTDIPAGVVNVLSGADPEVGAVLTASPDVDIVTFTGSTPTGRRIMAAASDTLKKVFLELGGKSAAIVLDDADFNTAALFSAFSMVTHAGQGCALTSRLLVPKKNHDEIVELVKNNFGLVRYGDPADPSTYMGPLISEKQRDKVDGMVKRAIEAGATLVTGGEKVGPGYFYTPTLLTNVDPDSEIAQEEVFGPVLVIIGYDDDDDAVRIANNSIYGLSGAVFGSEDRALAVARRIRTGTFSINGGMYFNADSPFGGYKQSGIGREMGTAGLEEFLESKTIATVVGS